LEKTQISKLKISIQNFIDGLIKPSFLAISVAISVVVLSIIILLLLINENTFGKQGGYRLWMQGPFDHYTYLSSNALNLKFRSLKNPELIILGSSSTHESFTTPEELSELLLKKSGKTVDVWDLTSSAQWNWEMIAVADKLPNGITGVVILPSSLSRFSSQAVEDQIEIIKHPKIGFTSQALDREIVLAGYKTPFRTGIYLFDNLQFFAVRAPYIINNLYAPKEHQRGYYSTIPKLTQEQWDDILVKHVKNKTNFTDSNVQAALRTYSRTIDMLRSKGKVSIVLLQDPMNPRYIDKIIGPDLYKKYQERLRHFADSTRTVFLDINGQVGLKDMDFYDHAHIRLSETKKRYSEILIDSLTAYF
jgi:hypothetical protein